MRPTLGRSHETNLTFALVVTGLFVVLQLVGHAHHELFRDELETLGFGRDALGLWDLLNGNRRYQGHPFLWYYVLHLFTRIDRSYVWLHVLTVAFASGAVFLWLRYAPLPRVLKVLAVSSYYFAYEYAVMCRGYTLGVFLIFAFCAVYRADRIRYVPLTLLLLLLAATSAYGFVEAAVLSLFLFTRGPTLDRTAAPLPKRRVAVPVAWIAAIGILVVGFAAVAATTRPPADALYMPHPNTDITAEAVRNAGAQYWRAMFPFQGLSWAWLGSDSVGSRVPALSPFLPWAGAACLAAWLFALRRSPRLAIAYGLGALLFAAIQYAVYKGFGWRHVGHNFVLLVACIWLYARDRDRPRPTRLLYTMFAATLAIQIVATPGAFAAEWRTTLSRAAEVAQLIKEHQLESVPIVGDMEAPVSSIAVILDRPFLYPITGETLQVPVWHNRRSPVSAADLVSNADRLAREGGGTALLILSSDRGTIENPGPSTKLLWTTGPSVMTDESYNVYEIHAAPAVAAAPAAPSAHDH